MASIRTMRGLSRLPAAWLACGVAVMLPAVSIAASAASAQDPCDAVYGPPPWTAAQQRARTADFEACARGARQKRVHLLDLVFPKSAGWIRFDALPRAIPDGADVAALLRRIGFNTPQQPSDYANLAPDFRLVDVGGKSILLYSGPATDGEGDRTVVWQDYPTAPAPRSGDSPRVIEVIRVKQGNEPRMTGIARGCCADPAEAFYRMDLLEPDGAEIVRSSTMLEIPDGTMDLRMPVALSGGCTMRFAPTINDLAGFQGMAGPQLGNIARKYAGIFDAIALMGFTDKAGRVWILIKTTSLDDSASTYSDPGQASVEIGWIDATMILNDPANASLQLRLLGH
jgi:hypothetical protein